MIRRQASVESISNGFAVLRIPEKTICNACLKGKGCGLSLMSGLFSRHAPKLKIAATEGMQVGDCIQITVERRRLEQMTLRLYCMPLALMLAGTASGHLVSTFTAVSSDALGLAGAGLGLLAAVLVNRVHMRRTVFPQIRIIHFAEQTQSDARGHA